MSNPSGYDVQYLDFGEAEPVEPSWNIREESAQKQRTLSEDIGEEALLRFQPARRRGLQFGSFGLVLEPELVYEVVEHARISPLPGASGVFKGIINHRGNVVPVYDLTRLTGTASEVWERGRLVMFNSGREAVALVVFELPFEVVFKQSVPLDGLDHRLPALLLDHALQVYRYREMLWLSMQYKSFFAALRDSCVQEETGASQG